MQRATTAAATFVLLMGEHAARTQTGTTSVAAKTALVAAMLVRLQAANAARMRKVTSTPLRLIRNALTNLAYLARTHAETPFFAARALLAVVIYVLPQVARAARTH